MTRIFLVCLLIILSAGTALAHEVRPAFLQIEETSPAEFTVLWKQPVLDGKRLRITPVFPDVCERSETTQTLRANTVNEQFDLKCDLKSGQITMQGLERTLTDIFVEIKYLDDPTRTALLKPASRNLDLSGPVQSSTREYLCMGVEHILGGWDHLLFVIGLTLLVTRRQILGVATSFTIAHSITLALAAFGLLALPIRVVELLIAASIVLLAMEILRKKTGEDSLAARRPYLIGFVIGLIHGCGFASALAEIGLPKGTELFALLLFNIGVELGQFAVIGLAIFVFALIARTGAKNLRFAELMATYFIGALAMFWVIDRGKDYIL
ncbi:MAG: HupE/UreJ family protein [Acidimicrobiales bacterium]|nr:MAG: HupE/UreJ family protein [Acidimicrobiales bacterium]